MRRMLTCGGLVRRGWRLDLSLVIVRLRLLFGVRVVFRGLGIRLLMLMMVTLRLRRWGRLGRCMGRRLLTVLSVSLSVW